MKNYKITRTACYLGYVNQAAVNNFLPLFYVMFNEKYGVSFAFLALVGVFNFIIQLGTDLLSDVIVTKIGYRKSAITAHLLVLLGFVLLAILPRVMNPSYGILIAVAFYAIGGGMDEVIISPVIESCPSAHKERQMAILHAMYCFGAFAVITVAVLFLLFFDITYWWCLTLGMCILPVLAVIFFCFCPMDIAPAGVATEEGKTENVFKKFSFYVFLVLILGAGATEAGIAQWISTYAELGLKVAKPYGDLYGAALFALFMGISRIIYSVLSKRVPLKYIVLGGVSFCITGYLLASLPKNSFVNFLGCLLVGVGVAPLWPAVFSMAVKDLGGSTRLFAFLALAGDIGCGAGTYLVGSFADSSSVSQGILFGLIFPGLFLVFNVILLALSRRKRAAQP